MVYKIKAHILDKNRSYSIVIGVDLLNFTAWLPSNYKGKLVIITDHIVKKKYGIPLQNKLKKSNYNCILLSFPAGEKYKNILTKQAIENAMFKQNCDRNTIILALGGGVVGDIAGYIAATYMRGISYIQIPTTFLAMIDSSVGGKTGINNNFGKNLIGCIYQPTAVIIDTSFLKTLSKRHKINGMVEAIKIFLTYDAKYFQYICKNIEKIFSDDKKILHSVLKRALSLKALTISRDENEKGERCLLNFGHTIGHALEKLSNYTLLHGKAVAYGILVEATLSHLLGLLKHEHLAKIHSLMDELKIYGRDLKKYNFRSLVNFTKRDKKSFAGETHYVLLQKIGAAYVKKNKYSHRVPDSLVLQALKICQEA